MHMLPSTILLDVRSSAAVMSITSLGFAIAIAVSLWCLLASWH
jgi:hypothetical protein